MATNAESLRILVVATREVASAVRELLATSGFSEAALGDGGDDTFSLYEENAPHVVLLGAHLERGDSRSLAAAMKGGAHGDFVRIILLGEADGPIRNALDAADFEVDRFIGSPLSQKALSFAVHSCGTAAKKDLAARPEAPPTRADERPMPVREPTLIVAPPTSDAPFPITAQTPRPRTAPPPPPGSAVRVARVSTKEVDAAVAGLPPPADFEDSDPGTTNPRVGFAPTELSAPPNAPAGDAGRHSHLIDEAMEAAIAEFVNDAIQNVARHVSRPAEPDGVPVLTPQAPTEKAQSSNGGESSPPSGWREPTLILPGTGAGPDAPIEAALDVTAESTKVPWVSDAEQVGIDVAADVGLIARGGDGDDDLGDLDEDLGDLDDDLSDLDDDLRDLEGIDDVLDETERDETTLKRDELFVTSAKHVAPVTRSPSGGMARELRRKMSAMAERLFPERQGEVDPTFALPHDANTEIDLAALEGQTGIMTAAPYRGIGRVETFADTNPLLHAADVESPDAALGTQTGVLGLDVSSGGEDIATLMARLHQTNFSGSLKLIGDDAEKTVFFDSGRPVFASSTVARDRMGDLLFREGKISRTQHAECHERVVSSGRRMGELLVEMGFLKPRELLPAVRRHIEDIIYSMFGWSSGEFAISEREPAGERIRLSRHPAALVIEGVRRKYGLERIEACLGSLEAVLAPNGEKAIEAIVELADLSSDERTAIKLFDGVRGLDEVSALASVDRLTVGQLGFALVALGVVDIVFRTDDDAATDGGKATALVGETDIAIDRQRVLAKLALVEEADYFMLLGVRRDASRFEIQRAYEAARRDYASDAFPDAVREELADEISVINSLIDEAFRILGDDRMRRSYAAHLG